MEGTAMQMKGSVRRISFLLSVVFLASLMTGFFHNRNYEGVTFPNTDSVEIQGTFYRPKGEGPFPSVVLLHTSGGMGEHVLDWAKKLAKEGYLALAVDSFGSRGRDDSLPAGADIFNMTKDAYGARDYLKTLAYADKKAIGVMGFSLGAIAALEASSFAEAGFRAGVALYPKCHQWEPGESVPVLLLLAGEDNWEFRAVKDCLAGAEISRKLGRIIELKVYSGVHHGFDQERFSDGFESSKGVGGFLEYSPEATTDAWKRIRIFFNKHLRSGK
jgi:dienelactone hydrolase